MHLRKLRKEPNAVSLQEPLESGQEGSLTVLDVLACDFEMGQDTERREELAQLHRQVDALPARERQVVVLRYGLGGQPPLTQQEVAGLLGISRSYISRIEKRALEQLRVHLLRADAP